jgi:hypothetical protein
VCYYVIYNVRLMWLNNSEYSEYECSKEKGLEASVYFWRPLTDRLNIVGKTLLQNSGSKNEARVSRSS